MDQASNIFSNTESKLNTNEINVIKEMEKKERLWKFSILAVPTLIYSVLTTFFLYKNFGSIMSILFSIITVVYLRVMLKRLSIEIKKGVNYYFADIILFGIANAITDNGFIIFLNNVAIFVLIICVSLYTTYDQKNWAFKKYVSEFFTSVLNSIGYMGEFFTDLIVVISETKNKKTKKGLYCVLGIVIFIPMALILVPLLASADAVFNALVKGFLNRLWSVDVIIFVPMFFTVVFLFAYSGMRFLDKRNIKDTTESTTKWSAIIANTILLLTNVIYIIFSGIQICSLFLGKMKLPETYTYAQYAREGFFELMFVCFLNLCIVLFAKSHFEKSFITNILLCIVSGCTYIMLASSAMRLILYIEKYNFTVLRFEVIVALIVMAISLVFIIISIFNEKINLVKVLAKVLIIGMLFLAFIRPDAVVAKYNLSHINEKTDYYYLQSLSADAAPFINKSNDMGVHKDSYFHELKIRQDEYSWRQFNISRYIASTF